MESCWQYRTCNSTNNINIVEFKTLENVSLFRIHVDVEHDVLYLNILEGEPYDFGFDIMEGEQYVFDNISTIFPADNQFHTIYVYYSNNTQILSVDGQCCLNHTKFEPFCFDCLLVLQYISTPIRQFNLLLGGHGSLDATVANICIKTKIRDDVLTCNTTFDEIVYDYTTLFWYLTIDHQQSIWISSHGYHDPQILLYDMNLTVLANKTHLVAIGSQVLIHSLPAGQYILNVFQIDVGVTLSVTILCGFENTILQQNVGCGDYMNGTVSQYHPDYNLMNGNFDGDVLHVYYFNLSYDTTVLFDTCESNMPMADFILKPMGVDHNMRHATWDERNWGVISDIYDIVEFCEDDDSGEFKYAYSMEPGQYVLEIHNYNEDDR
eukprot:268868_1